METSEPGELSEWVAGAGASPRLVPPEPSLYDYDTLRLPYWCVLLGRMTSGCRILSAYKLVSSFGAVTPAPGQRTQHL